MSEGKDTPIESRNTRADTPEMRKHNILFAEGGQLHEIEDSLCMLCGAEGKTKLLMTKIPLFKDLLISSFECSQCHYRETDIRSTAELQPYGITYELTVDPLEHDEATIQRDLSRLVVRSQTARIKIPELDFCIEPKRGEVNTVEGFLRNIRESLLDSKPRLEPSAHPQVDEVVRRITMMEEGKDSFTFIVDDAAGNSFLENPYAPKRDPRCKVTKRIRTRAETIEMGYDPGDDDGEANPRVEETKGMGTIKEGDNEEEDDEKEENKGEAAQPVFGPQPRPDFDKLIDSLKGLHISGSSEILDSIAVKNPVEGRPDVEVPSRDVTGYKSGGSKAALNVMAATMLDKRPLDRFEAIIRSRDLTQTTFRGECHACHKENETRMCIFQLPYFGETIIMCTDCQYCGFRDSEIKPGGATADYGVQIELKVTTPEDLTRDVLKSDHAAVIIKELDLMTDHGTLGGKFSTVEGLLLDIKNQLESTRGFYVGDSAREEQKENFDKMLKAIDDCLAVKEPFTFILDDPAGQSFIEGRANGVPDTNPYDDMMIKIVKYQRTDEQNEMLGISQMKTEDYE